MGNSDRGLGKLKKEGREDEIRDIASKGGQSSPTKFQAGDRRTEKAAQKGGNARANDPDVKSGELGRRGAEARWGDDDK